MNLVTTALLTTMLASFLNGEEMRERRNAKSLFPSRMVNSFKRPVSYEERQWYLKDTPISMNVKSAWQAGFTGKDILVAVVDDGVNMNHHDLKPKFNSKVSYDFLKNRSISTDYSPGSHGTMCAGIIAGGYDKSDCGVGVAYDAQIARSPRKRINICFLSGKWWNGRRQLCVQRVRKQYLHDCYLCSQLGWNDTSLHRELCGHHGCNVWREYVQLSKS